MDGREKRGRCQKDDIHTIVSYPTADMMKKRQVFGGFWCTLGSSHKIDCVKSAMSKGHKAWIMMDQWALNGLKISRDLMTLEHDLDMEPE